MDKLAIIKSARAKEVKDKKKGPTHQSRRVAAPTRTMTTTTDV
jgi:hypothetical protein